MATVPSLADAADSSVTIIAHPAERRSRRPSIPAQAGHCCCCCCCCCLHSLGAVIGAAVAPNLGGGSGPRSYLPLMHYWDEVDDPGAWAPHQEAVTARPPDASPISAEPLRSYERTPNIALAEPGAPAVAVFWWTLLVLVILGMIVGAVNGPTGILVGVVIILLVLPGMQLAAALFTAIILGVSERRDK